MRLLFILQELPYPATNGHRQKVHALLSYLATRHECDILAFGDQSDLARCETWLSGSPGIRILGLFKPKIPPFLRVRQVVALVLPSGNQSSLRYHSVEMERAIEQAVAERRYDVAHVDLISMAPYCLKLGKVRRVLSLNDSLSLTQLGRVRNHFAPAAFRVSAFVQALFQLRVDKSLFRLADAVHFVSWYDSEWSRNMLSARNAVFIPLSVPQECLDIVPSTSSLRECTLLIVDKLWADQHRLAVERFLVNHWRGLREKHPGARLVIIGGKGIPSRFVRMATDLPGVEVHEWVPNLNEVLTKIGIALFPYSVEVGMKTRVLQCMAAANAVVATRNGFLGLPIRDDFDAVIVEDLAEMTAAADELLSNPEQCRRVGLNGRRFVKSRFTEARIGEAWEELYHDTATGIPVRKSYGASDTGPEE